MFLPGIRVPRKVLARREACDAQQRARSDGMKKLIINILLAAPAALFFGLVMAYATRFVMQSV